MPHILVTNDDGVHSEGIHALAEAVRPFGDVTVVAPAQVVEQLQRLLASRRFMVLGRTRPV